LIATSQAYNDRYGDMQMGRLRRNSSPIKEERVMKKATSTLIAALAALTLSGVAYAQNNTLATPTTVSPAATATSGYGAPGATNSESGMAAGSSNSNLSNSSSNSAAALTNLPGSHNTLATPSTASPAGQ